MPNLWSETDVKKSNDELTGKWCPFTGTRCKQACACFCKSYIRESDGQLIAAHCKSPLVSGAIEIYGSVTNYNQH